MRHLLLLSILLTITIPASAVNCGNNNSWKLMRRTQTMINVCMEFDKPTDDVSKGRIQYTDDATYNAEFTSEEILYNDPDYNGACIWIAELKTNTQYLFDFQLYDVSDASFSDYTSCQTEITNFDCNGFSNCSVVDADGGGAGTDVVVQITTSAGTGVPTNPVAPTHSISESFADTIDGSTVTVNCVGGEGDNFQSLLTTAGSNAAGDGLTYGIKIPAGCTVKPEWETTAVPCWTWPDPSPGEIKIFSEYPDTDAQPPVGGQIDLNAGVGAIEYSDTVPNTGCSGLVDLTSKGRYQFELIKLGVGPWQDYAVPDVQIASASGSPTVITTSSDIPRESWGDSSFNLGVAHPGLESNCFRVGWLDDGTTSGNVTRTGGAGVDNQITCRNITDPGSDTGTGYVYNRLTTEFTSCTKASQPVCTTAAAHPYLDSYQYTLTSITAGTKTALVSGGTHAYVDDSNYRSTYWVQGTTGGCDGFFEGDAGGSGTIVFTDTPAGDCTGGTIQQVFPVWVHNVDLDAGESGMSCMVEYTSNTTVKLLTCRNEGTQFTPDFTSEVGTITGYFSVDPFLVAPLIQLNGASDIVFDRVIFDCGDGPWRCGTIIAAGGRPENVLITGFAARGFRGSPINPVTGKAHADERINPGANMQFIRTNDGVEDWKITNGVLYTDGYVYFHATPSPDDDVTTNLTISNLRYRTLPYMTAGHADAWGRTGVFRQGVEAKVGLRYAEFDGWSVEGLTLNGTAAPYAILCQAFPDTTEDGTYYHECSDISITNSYFKTGFAISIGVHVLGGSASAIPVYGPAERIKIDNNIFESAPNRTKPSGQVLNEAGFLPGASFYPTPVLLTKLSEAQVTNNTWMPVESDAGFVPIMQVQNAHTSSFKMDGNLIFATYTGTASYQKIRCNDINSSDWVNCVEAVFRHDGVFSAYADFAFNKVVAAGLTAYPFDYDAVSSPCTSVASHWVDGSGYQTNFPLDSCTDAITPNARFDTVLTPGTLEPTVLYGADVDSILDAQGRIRAVDHSSTATSIKISYTAPSTGSCILSYGVSPVNFNTDTDISALGASSGSKARTETITGLSGSTVYDYKISCADGGSVLGRLTTQ